MDDYAAEYLLAIVGLYPHHPVGVLGLYSNFGLALFPSLKVEV